MSFAAFHFAHCVALLLSHELHILLDEEQTFFSYMRGSCVKALGTRSLTAT